MAHITNLRLPTTSRHRSLMLACCIGSAPIAKADILYAHDRGILYRVNTDTLIAEPVGATGINFGFGGLEFGPDNRLFGVDADEGELVEIDANTASVSVIGSYGTTIARSTGLAWDHATNTMFGTTDVVGDTSNFLVTLNLNSGEATTVAEMTDILGSNISGISTDPLGNLYGYQGGDQLLWLIDKTSGEAVSIGSGGAGNFSSLTITPEGVAWSIAFGGTLHSIELEDGTSTNHGQISGFAPGNPAIGGLAYIPSPSTASLLVVGVLMGARRRNLT